MKQFINDKALVNSLVNSFVYRRARGECNPIYDFLFSYYNYSPSKLESYHPGFGRVCSFLTYDQIPPYFLSSPYEINSVLQATVSISQLRSKHLKQLYWVQALSDSILERSPRFTCFGLHEWAMLYRTTEIRHDYPLRLSVEKINQVVENMPIACSHFDAFRFFSPTAKSFNILQPNAETRLTFEQGGCIHANMDLYKWAYKLSPWVPSDLVQRCFLLAVYAREIDMRASPYDFSSLGFTPICIETVDGQQEYQTLQQELAINAKLLRIELLKEIQLILDAYSQLT
jgi:hypothetical protein